VQLIPCIVGKSYPSLRHLCLCQVPDWIVVVVNRRLTHDLPRQYSTDFIITILHCSEWTCRALGATDEIIRKREYTADRIIYSQETALSVINTLNIAVRIC